MDPVVGGLIGFGALVCLGSLALVLWLARSLIIERAKRRLNLEDLRLLEESTEHLVAALRRTADEAAARVEARVAEAREVLTLLEERTASLPGKESDPKASGLPPASPEAEAAAGSAPGGASEEGEGAASVAAPSPQPSGLSAGEPDAVVELAQTGASPEEIARKLGLGLGEVHLRLGLRQLAEEAGDPRASDGTDP